MKPYPPFAALGASLLLCACGGKNEYVPPPPLEVEVLAPAVGPIVVHQDFPGRTVPYALAEVRARVKGFLKEIQFRPGSVVAEGDPLFLIEPDQFEAAVATARAQVDRAAADLQIATTQFERRRQAAASGAVSEIEVAAAEAEVKAAGASVKMAESALADAERDLGYTRIASPLAGRVSKAAVDVGNLVGSDGATLLTTVVADNPIYVVFEVNERDVLRHLPKRRLVDQGDPTESSATPPVRLTLTDGSVYPLEGVIDFIDNAVDPDTGTIRARAVFENPEGALAAGLFVRVGLPVARLSAEDSPAIRVPADVVQRDLGGSFVLVVGDDGVVERRPVVTTAFREGADAILDSGLTAADRVVVSHLQKVRAGAKVVPKPRDPPTSPEPSSEP